MWLRKELYQAYYDKLGERQLAAAKSDESAVHRLDQEVEDLHGDLRRLASAPNSEDPLEELHLRFLARSRLIQLGDYLITGYIGAGQCGVVYRCRSEKDASKEGAIKLLFFPRNQEEEFRFKQEGDIVFRLDHPAIVKGLLPTKRVEYLPVQWYAMELVQNAVTLESFWQSHALKDTLAVVAEACAGIAYAHEEQIIHRDLHLKNVLVLADGRPKILDFGSAKHGDEAMTFRPVGGLKCCSPEKLEAPQQVDGKSDVFSIGCILYYIVSGRWPFYAGTFGELVRKVTTCQFVPLKDDAIGLSRCIHSCLQREPAQRPPAQQVETDLWEVVRRLQ
jgi:serine/threonine protein kinase